MFSIRKETLSIRKLTLRSVMREMNLCADYFKVLLIRKLASRICARVVSRTPSVAKEK